MTEDALFTVPAPLDAGALVLERVSAGYGSAFTLQDVSFEAPRGAVVGVIGPNGSGKSTLLKAIAGVLPRTAGHISFAGRPLRLAAGRLAFVPQREEVNWQFPVTAKDVVLMGRARVTGWCRPPRAEDRRLAELALDRMGLGGLGGRHISQFSGGQQQRVFLARAIVQEPAIVLLDEPFTGIDIENRAVFHAAIREFASAGVIVLIATHDLEEVTYTCSHICALDGRLVAFGPTATTYTEEVLRKTFGGQVAVISR